MMKFDIHLCTYNGELKIMAEFLAKIYSDPKHLTGLNKVCLATLTAVMVDGSEIP
jgi:hypothetical protein